ncbi:hypothetical protein F183_A40410 [Bryobacterales bacterium F-183]|nr:hypothetical protein F183_A40410 [Bryobacterales bacterium F-183]
MNVLAARNPATSWREVSVTAADGVRLDAYFVQPASGASTQCVVVLHGIGDSRGSGSAGFVRMLAGYSMLLPDIRGHGTSGGDLMTFGIQEKQDLLQWVRWLRGQQNCQRVYGLGESLGGAILVQAAALDPSAFTAIVAECSFADLPSVARYRVARLVPEWIAAALVNGAQVYAKIRYGLDLAQASPVAGIAQAKPPILLIHGLEDHATPAEHSRKLAAAASKTTELWLVPAAGHVAASRTSPDEFRQRVLQWFKR